jgi:hypothetical protein
MFDIKHIHNSKSPQNMKWLSQCTIEKRRITPGDVLNDLFSAATHHARRWLENKLRKYCIEFTVNVFIFGSILREMLRTSTVFAIKNGLLDHADDQDYDKECFISPQHDMDIFVENDKELDALLDFLGKNSNQMYWKQGYKRNIYPGLQLRNYRLYFGGVVFPKVYLSVDFVCPSGGNPISDFTCNSLQLNLRTGKLSYMYPPAQKMINRLRPKGFLNLDEVTETVRYICTTGFKKTQIIVLSPESWEALFDNKQNSEVSYKQYLRHLFANRVNKILTQQWEIVNLSIPTFKLADHKYRDYQYRFPCGCEPLVIDFKGDQLKIKEKRVIYTCCNEDHIVTHCI